MRLSLLSLVVLFTPIIGCGDLAKDDDGPDWDDGGWSNDTGTTAPSDPFGGGSTDADGDEGSGGGTGGGSGDGSGDEGPADDVLPTDELDNDGDGFSVSTGDCDDTSAEIHPGATDIWYDGIDSDCRGDDDYDKDGDGYRTAYHVNETGEYGTDCLDDEDEDDGYIDDHLASLLDETEITRGDVLAFIGLGAADIHPDAVDTPYDGLDQNCDEQSDCDVDGDGYDATGTGLAACESDPDHLLCEYNVCENVDCNDFDDAVSPTGEEVYYNGIDDDCNHTSGDGDADRDGYWVADYASLVPGSELEPPIGRESDCNDEDADVYPGAIDYWYDGVDSDCDGADDCDADGDGYLATASGCGGTDCDDTEYDSTSIENDADCDGVITAEDCDDTDDTAGLCWLDVSAGGSHTCGITLAGRVVCWGDEADGKTSPPSVSFVSLSAGTKHTCGITTLGHIECWGYDDHWSSSTPEGVYEQVSVGLNWSCALTGAHDLACWGWDGEGEIGPAPSTLFENVSVGSCLACGIASDGDVECWGSRSEDEITGAALTPSGSFESVSAGAFGVGIRPGGALECWSYRCSADELPTANFESVSVGSRYACGITTDSDILCWGDDEHGETSPPGGSFASVSAGAGWGSYGVHTCGVTTGGVAECWGNDDYGQSTPPER